LDDQCCNSMHCLSCMPTSGVLWCHEIRGCCADCRDDHEAEGEQMVTRALLVGHMLLPELARAIIGIIVRV
jgi:hypothetical protein